MNVITYGNVTSSDYNVYAAGAGMYSKPERIVTNYHIPGKNGDLVVDDGEFENVDIEFDGLLPQEFQESFDDFCAAMYAQKGYNRLEESMHPDHFRLAVFADKMTAKPTRTYKGGTFKLVFDAMPQRFLKSGEIQTTVTTESYTITNPTLYPAKPIIRVWGYGTLKIGSITMTILEHYYEYMDIDCEAQDAYYVATPLNKKLMFSGYSFPVLTPGANNIVKASTISRYTITPRWWEI